MNTYQVEQTKEETAAIIVDEIGRWLAHPRQEHHVYVSVNNTIETRTHNMPADHLADIFTVNTWAFGDRDTDDIDAPLTPNEIDGLIELFTHDWLPTEFYHDEDGRTIYLEYAAS